MESAVCINVLSLLLLTPSVHVFRVHQRLHPCPCESPCYDPAAEEPHQDVPQSDASESSEPGDDLAGESASDGDREGGPPEEGEDQPSDIDQAPWGSLLDGSESGDEVRAAEETVPAKRAKPGKTSGLDATKQKGAPPPSFPFLLKV